MDKKMVAMCGTYCGACEWKDKFNCSGVSGIIKWRDFGR